MSVFDTKGSIYIIGVYTTYFGSLSSIKKNIYLLNSMLNIILKLILFNHVFDTKSSI